MKKTAFKTFVSSFVFSLFTILVVNGAYLHTRKSNSSQVKIPQKNITLFIKNNGVNKESLATKTIEVKKIALTKKVDAPVYAEIEPISISPQIADDEVLVLDSTTLAAASQIPLDIDRQAKINAEIQRNKAKIQAISSQKSIEKPKIIDDFNSFKKTSPKIEEDNILVTKEPELVMKNFASKSQSQASLGKADKSKDGLILKASIPLEKGVDSNANTQVVKIAKNVESNQIALADGSIPVKSFSSENTQKATDVKPNSNKNKWNKLEDMDLQDNSTWLVAKGSPHPKNSLATIEGDMPKAKESKPFNKSKKHLTNDSFEIASETLQNLIIPIPKSIMDEENIVPNLSSQASSASTEENSDQIEDEADKILKEIDFNTPDMSQAKDDKSANKSGEKKNIISSISSIFSSPKDTKPTKEVRLEEPTNDDKDDNIIDIIKGKIKRKNDTLKILPTEIRLSFQANRAEISGQTLKWLHAFAQKVQEDSSSALEIRIDGTSSMELQQKRLNLLHNILTNSGVEYHKINTVFTTREPNSFIIRTTKVKQNIGNDYRPSPADSTGYVRW